MITAVTDRLQIKIDLSTIQPPQPENPIIALPGTEQDFSQAVWTTYDPIKDSLALNSSKPSNNYAVATRYEENSAPTPYNPIPKPASSKHGDFLRNQITILKYTSYEYRLNCHQKNHSRISRQ